MQDGKEQLEACRGLEKDWNGYGADPFKEELINLCVSLYDSLSIKPKVFPTARDSIQFEYEKENGDYLEFEIYQDHISIFRQQPDGIEDDKDIPHDAQELERWIEVFYKH